MDVRKYVILAAEFGTRFLPLTKAQPKEMMPVLDKPTIQYLVEEVIDGFLIITDVGNNRSNATSTSPTNSKNNWKPREKSRVSNRFATSRT